MFHRGAKRHFGAEKPAGARNYEFFNLIKIEIMHVWEWNAVNLCTYQCLTVGYWQNGALVLVVTYGRDKKSDKFKVTPDPRLDNNEWHDVYFTRRNRQVHRLSM